jgi:hypothetical protein
MKAMPNKDSDSEPPLGWATGRLLELCLEATRAFRPPNHCKGRS